MLYINQKGNVEYVIVGSPAIVDGILENPNRQNYIKTDTTFQDTGDDFRLHVEFVRTASGSVPILGTNQTGGARPLLALDASKPRFRIGTGVNIYGVQSLWRTNTPYAIDISRTGNMWTLKSFMNGNQVDIQTLESSALLNDGAAFTWVFGCDFAVYGGGIEGNIDLNKTYINYDKEAWFGICPIEVKKHQIMGPVGYTVVGSPTITNGVAIGFSKNNYLSLGNFPQNVTDLEIQIKFKTGSASDVDVWQGLFSINSSESGHNVYIRYNRNTRQISFSPNFLYSNENFILYSNALEYETWYTYKISKVGNVYTLYKNGVAEDTATSTLAIEPNNLETRLGFVRIYTGSTVGGFNSSIDLNHTYIKVNGKLWYWQPQETKRIVVNGVEVWTKPE